MADPTIVLASLSDDKLKESINSLVKHVNDKMGEMVESTNSAVKKMEDKLKSLGDLKIDSNGTSDGGASRRTKSQNAETDAIEKTVAARDKQIKKNKEVEMSFDQMQSGIQKATQPKTNTASDSYYTFIKNLRENVALLAMEIKSIPSWSLDKQFNAYMQYEQQIEQLKNRIAELRQQMQESANDPNASRLVKKQALEEISSLEQKIVQVEREQISVTQQIANSDKQMLAEKQALYEKQRQELIALSAGERERVTFTQSQTNELEKQLQKIRDINTAKQAKEAFANVSSLPSDSIEQARQKVEALQALLEKTRNTPLLSKSNIKSIEQSVDNLKIKIEQLGIRERGGNQDRASLEAQNKAVERTIALEKQRHYELYQTGLVARRTAEEIRHSMYEQVSSEGDKPITKIKELGKALVEMRRLYYDLPSKESPFAISLKHDIDITQKALIVAQKYNQMLLGLGSKEQFTISKDSSLSSLRNSLKSLTEQYNSLTIAEIRSGSGDEIIQKFQKISRAAQVLQKQLNTPISFSSIMGYEVKTLDDISYKMQMLRSYKQQIDLTKPSAANDIKQVDDALIKLQKDADRWMAKSKQIEQTNTALGRSWNYMKNRLAFYFTVGATTSFVKQLADIRSQYEMNERALGILINSAEKGTQVFQELSQMSLVSPYTLIELSTAAKQLTAYDVAARDVVDTTRRLADMAAAVGIPIERLTYALGQVNAYGYLNARDARMFSNAGIPLVKQLADHFTELEGKMVSTADVYDRIKKKAIGYNDVMEVVGRMTDEGGKFFDFQSKMADTLKVRLANLTLAWNNMINEIGKSEQGVLTTGIGALRNLFLHWKDIKNTLENILIPLGAIKVLQIAIWGIMRTFGARVVALEAVVGKRIAGIARSLKSLFLSAKTWATIGVAAIFSMVSAFVRGNEEMREFNRTLRENAKNTYDDIASFAEQYEKVRKSLWSNKVDKDGNVISSTPISIDDSEAKKVWEAMREQIELSSHAGEEFVGKLLLIEDVSERLRQGFGLLDEMQEVNAALKEIGDDGITVTKEWSAWWNLWQAQDGLVENLKDLSESKKEFLSLGVSESEARDMDSFYRKRLTDYERDLERFRDDLAETANSIIQFLELKGWSGDETKINEVFKNITDNIILKNTLTPQQAFELQMEMETYRANAAKKALKARLDDALAALKIVHGKEEAEYASSLAREFSEFDKFNGKSRVLWESYTKWMKEQHISEMRAKFRNMDSDMIKDLDFTKGEWYDWVVDTSKKFAKEHKMSFDETFNYLKNWVTDASKWEIFIGLALGDGKMSPFQKEYQRLIGAGSKLAVFSPKENDTLPTWVDEQQKQIKSLEEDEKKYKKIDSEFGRQKLKETQDEISLRKQALDLFNQSYKKDKKGGNKKDPILEAIKLEIDLIKRLQGEYDKLVKSGARSADALDTIRSAYGKTIKEMNTRLGAFGFPKINLAMMQGKDPNKVLEFFNTLRNTLENKGLSNIERMKAVEGVIEEFTLSAKTYNLDKITKGLNNELDKIKDEYELAVELDANPELGGMFAEMMGINTDSLPQTFGEAFDKANEVAKQKLRELNVDTKDFDLMKSVIKPDDTGKWMGLEFEGNAVKELLKGQKMFQDLFKKNLTETEKNLDDFIKKYGLYADKVAEIESNRLEKIKRLNDTYYMEEMRKMPEYIAKLNAINEGASREKSNAEFDEFKNSRYYTMIFENLDYVSTKTIRDMRDRLRDLMDTMNNLTPEQLKQIMSQYEKLEQKLSKRSPFRTLAGDLKSYFKDSKNRKAANESFRNAQKEYDAQMKKVAAMKENYEQLKSYHTLDKDGLKLEQDEINTQQEILDRLREKLELAQKIADKYNLAAKIAKEEALAAAQMVASNLSSLSELRDNLKETFGLDMGDNVNAAIDGFAKAGEGISKAISSLQSGDVVGGASGVVSIIGGIGDGIASIFGDGAARTKRINKEINKSKESVRQLNMAYKDLERTVEKSLGTAETEARRAAIANKEAELAEIEKQLALEESKRSKDKDEDAIKQYQETIQDLRYEIEDLKDDLVNNLFGEDVKSAAEAFVDAWVEAWRAGETTLDAMQEKMDEMIFHLIKKAMTAKLVETLLKPLYDEIDYMTKAESEGGEEITINELKQLAKHAGLTAEQINTALGAFYGNLDNLGIVSQDTKGKNLSALAQGIQGITEDTAGALESYMNGVSQQVYLHSDLLTQIRDAVVGFDVDVQVATVGQILLQLQSSYQVHMAIRDTLQGWSNASGMAVRVEMI